MPTKPRATPHYNKLITSIKNVLSKGLFAAEKALEYQRVKTYWTIGKEIQRAVNLSKGELQTNEALYQRITETIYDETKLTLTTDTLRRTIQFYKEYPKFPTKTSLSFAHYLTLMRIDDKSIREKIQIKANQENLSILELKELLFEIKKPHSKTKTNSKKLSLQRGEPFLYKIITRESVTTEKKYYLDCGFKIHVELNGKVLTHPIEAKTSINRVVKSVKKDGEYKLALVKKTFSQLYTYCAQVTRVVDGDTLDARIDLGFNIQVHDRFRLSFVNASEIGTSPGRRAKEFLYSYLQKCPKIIIRTTKAGVYGRWLAEVFALPDSEDPYQIAHSGTYINQLLLDEGLAQRY